MMIRSGFIFILLYLLINDSVAQDTILHLWPNGEVPYQLVYGDPEDVKTDGIIRISNVQEPSITVYLPSPAHATGEAVVICPGGGYWILAWDKEGEDIAKWFNSIGVAAAVLKYRLPDDKKQSDPQLVPLTDARRAIKMVRHHANEWNVNPEKVGVMGFSAGGHLAATVSTQYDYGDMQHVDPIEKLSSRPDFSILMYPVISSDTSIWHQGSFHKLLGIDGTPELFSQYSAEKQVKDDNPPAILIHAADDGAVPVENSILYFAALNDKGIPAEMHVYPAGGHGFGLAVGKGYLSSWPQRVADWLKNLP